MECLIRIEWDKEAGVWTAINDYLPLALESESMDTLIDRVRKVIPEMIELNHLQKPKFIYFIMENREEVYA